jgi:hypothetical protein
VEPPLPCREILLHVKETYEYGTYIFSANFNGHFFAKFLLLRYYLLVIAGEFW